MTRGDPARRTGRRIPGIRGGVLVAILIAVIAVTLGHAVTSTSTVASALVTPEDDRRGAVGELDGVLPAGTTAFANLPGIANLDPALLAALRRAATEAAHDGVELVVESGWRSPAYQAQLLQQAVSDYGSAAEAARWVATPDRSPHVAGAAVDLGPAEATAWLSAHGSRYGLCQIFRNEPWHYELRPEAIDAHCPRMYADPTRDPRLQP